MMHTQFSGMTYYVSQKPLPDLAEKLQKQANQNGNPFAHLVYGKAKNNDDVVIRDVLAISHPDEKNFDMMMLGNSYDLIPVQLDTSQAPTTLNDIIQFTRKSLPFIKDFPIAQVMKTLNL